MHRISFGNHRLELMNQANAGWLERPRYSLVRIRRKRKALVLNVVTFFTWERKNKEETWRVLSLWDVEKNLRQFAGLKSTVRFTGRREGMSQVIKNSFLSLAAVSYCQVQCILVLPLIPFLLLDTRTRRDSPKRRNTMIHSLVRVKKTDFYSLKVWMNSFYCLKLPFHFKSAFLCPAHLFKNK